MTQTVEFPNLGLHLQLNRVAFSVFGFSIYWYALIITAGILLAYLYIQWEGKRQGISSDTFYDILIIGLPSAIIGARLYYVLFRWDYYHTHLLEIFNLREGGIAIYGAIIASVIAVYFYLRKKKQPVLKIFDICIIGVLIGQCIGRWGNFVNVEAYGYVTDSFFKMGITDAVSGNRIYVHPTFFYESIWSFFGVLLLAWRIRRKKMDGEIFSLYLIWYGAGRMFIEGLRTDSLMFYNIRISQLVAAASILMGMTLLIYLPKRIKNNKMK